MKKGKGAGGRRDIYLKSLSYVFGPWHPPLVQFPVVSSILGALAFWLGRTYGFTWSVRAAGVIWILSFGMACLSWFTGHFFAHRLGRYSKWTFLPPSSTGPLHFHALLGTIGAGFSLLTLPGAFRILLGLPVHDLTLFFLGVGEAVFFAWGAHEGGEMTYRIEMVPLNAPHPRKGPRRLAKGKKPLFRFRIF